MKEQFLLRKVKDNCFILSNCPIKVVGGAISSNTLRLVDTLDHLINIFISFVWNHFSWVPLVLTNTIVTVNLLSAVLYLYVG